MTLLYLAAITLASYKVCSDLNAFTEQSPKRVDLAAFIILGIIALALAMAIPQALPAIDVGCGLDPCWNFA
jgi:hypothetical protein